MDCSDLPITPSPISSMRVLSFGQAIAGNATAMALAELGAEVVKIEAHSRPDPNRVRMNADDPEPRVFDPGGHETNTLFATFSRSVKSISLDMRDSADEQVFCELLGSADVLLENFGPGVMEKWGLTPKRLLELNPRIVYISISGYGRTGPRSSAVAYGSNVHAYVGLTRTWTVHGTHLDWVASASAVVAVLSGLASRDRTGSGVYIDLAQSEAGAATLSSLYLPALNQAAEPPGPSAGLADSLLVGVFACAGDQNWVAVEVRDHSQWNALCHILGRDDLGEEEGSATSRGEIESALNLWCTTLTPHQAMFRLQHAGIPAGAVRNGEDVFLDPQHAARSAFTQVDHPDLGVLLEMRSPVRMSKTDVSVRRPSPRVGQHTSQVIAEWRDYQRRKGAPDV